MLLAVADSRANMPDVVSRHGAWSGPDTRKGPSRPQKQMKLVLDRSFLRLSLKPSDRVWEIDGLAIAGVEQVIFGLVFLYAELFRPGG